ncbi:hypothetical protein ACHAXM_011919 [Skeletonema potamos]
MPSDYSPVSSGEGVDIASFDLEIAASRQRRGGGRGRNGGISRIGRNLIMCLLFASVLVAGYCIYNGTLDLPKGLIGAEMGGSDVDSPSSDDFTGLNDDDWENSSASMSSGYDKEDNIMSMTPEEPAAKGKNDGTSQQKMMYDGSQEVIAEPQQNNQQQPADHAPKLVFCYGDSLTFGLVPNEKEPQPYGLSLESEVNKLFSAASATSTTEIAHPPATIVQTLGFPGMTAMTMLNLIEKKDVGTCFVLENERLSVMIILTGTNDLGHIAPELLYHDGQMAIDTHDIAKKILESITNLHKATLECATRAGIIDMHILSLGIPGSAFQTKFPVTADIAAKVNKGLKKFSTSYNRQSPHGKIVYRDFPFAYDESDSKWGSDGLHLSRQGYEELGKALAPEVKSILDNMMYGD